MKSGSIPGASYALQVKISKFLFKKSTNYFLSSIGSWVPTWKYLSTFPSMTTFSNSSHDTEQSEESGKLSYDFYKTGSVSKGLTLGARWLTAATKHCLATAWHPTSSATPSLVGYFNFTCRVEEIAPVACSHGLTRMVVYGEKALTTMKFTLTTFSPICTRNQIIPFVTVTFQSNPTKRTS